MTARHTTTPNIDIDPARDEMLHSLFDGRAKHTVRHLQRQEAEQEKPRNRVTLARVFEPTYLA